MTDPITVHLTLSNVPNSARVDVQVSSDDNSSDFREKCSQASKIPLDSMRLIFRGRLIGKDSEKKVIEEFKLENDAVIHCMGKPIANEPTPAAPSTPVTAGSSVTVNPSGAGAAAPAPASAQTLASALTTMRTSNSSAVYLTAVTTLEKVLSNISNNPMEEKYRRVKRGNAAFNKRLGGVPGGEAAMMAVGFSIEDADGESSYVMHPSPEAWPMLMQHKAELAAAVQTAKNATAPAPIMPPLGGMPPGGMGGMPAGMPDFGGMPGMPPMGAGGMPQMTPQMQQAAAEMMRNPQQLQSMLQNPMVQNMLRSDPRFANNPMMQQSIDQMVNNPQMLQQMSQMMQNPELLNMMGEGGMGGMGGMGGAPQQQQQQGGNGGNSSGNQGQSDQAMTEEEMLEEAIRRSLNES